MKRILLFAVLLMFQLGFGQRTASVSGNWNDPVTWGGLSVPTSTDAVTINVGVTVTVNNTNAFCASLQVGTTTGTATLTFSGTTSQLTVSGNVILGNSANANIRGDITFTSGSVLIVNGSVTNGNNGANGTITMTAGGELRTNSFSTSTGTWTPGTGTVNLTATNTLPSSIFTSFNNLNINSGTTTMGTGLTINGNLNIASGATLNTNNSGLTFLRDFTNNGGTFIAGSSTITLSGTATQNIAGFTTTGAVSMIKTIGDPATFTGNVNGGSLVINGSGGKLNLGSGLTHTFTGDWTRTRGELKGGSSLLKIGGNVSGTGSTFTADTGTVEFNGGNQNLGSSAITYNNLILSGSGTKTLGAVTTVSDTWSIVAPVRANLGTFTTHGAKTLLLHGNGPLSGAWGSTSSGVPVANQSNTFFEVSAGRINVISLIDNNYASYNNATGDVGGGVIGENNAPLTLTAPNGSVFINTKFASYGTPNGSYPNFTIGGCHAVNSREVTTGLLGNTSATIPAGGASFNTVFGDPCSGTIKKYYVVATYALPICSGTSPGTITGSTPTGGNGTYTYLWEQSSSVNGIYATVSGTSNDKDYTPGALATTTYYRRTVTSGIYTDVTIVIVPVIPTAAPSAPTITALCSNSTLTVPTSSIPGTYVEWFLGSCGSTVIGTGTTFNPTVAGTYFARYTNRCSTSACSAGFVIGTAPTNPVSITPTNPSSICITGVDQTVSLAYSSTGTLSNYSIVWSPGAYLIDIADRPITSPISLNIPANVIAGTYTGTITVRNSGGCVSASKTFTLQIGKVVSTASSSPTLCQNTSMTPITHATTGATGIGTATGLPAGITAAWASNTITISGTPTASGTFNYSIPLTGPCSGTVNAIGTIIVNPAPSSPTVGTIIHPTCALATGSVALSGLPSSGSWTITATPATSGLTGLTGTNVDNTSIGGLTANTSYTFIVSNGTCSSVASAAAVVNAIPTTATWNGTAWVGTASSTTPPLITQPIVFSGNYTSTSDINGCSCSVTSGNVVINSGHTMTITNAINVTNNASTSLVFNDKSSLVQTTNATNTGAIEYRRISSPMKNFDYTYWSSPVTGQNIVALSPNTLADKYFRFNGNVAVNDWDFYNGTMVPGVGYIIRTPKEGNPWPNGEIVSFPYSQPVAFKGVPNNGDYSFSAGAGEFNLIGNPYPSAIDADSFMTNTNNASIINGALYFWTHNTVITNNEYTADDYASYTLTGGTGTGGVGNFVDANNNGIMDPVEEVVSNRPLGKIAAGQSFFVENAAAGSFQFTNTMRIAGNNSQFFKQANTKKTATVEKNRVWLNLTNSGGAFKQLLVGYITGATNDWDNLYDGPTFDGQEFVDFYSVNQGKNLTIQGRALPFVDTDVVPLGYRSTIAGSFDISIDNRDGSLAGQAIWLEDKKTNTLHELSKGKYTFTAINGIENDRFVLKYTSKTLGTDDNEVADKSLIVSVKNKKITLTSSAEAITQVQLFDLLGRKVYDKSKINAQEWSISNLPSSEQTLIVKTTLANGAISNKKIIY